MISDRDSWKLFEGMLVLLSILCVGAYLLPQASCYQK